MAADTATTPTQPPSPPVLLRFKDLENKVRNQRPSDDLSLLRESFDFAAAQHGNQKQGPIKEDEAKTELAEMNMPIIEDGMKCLETAIELDPDYDDAMAYLNLLYRERADISETKEEYDEYTAQADNWVQQTLDTKKRKAEASTRELFQEGQ